MPNPFESGPEKIPTREEILEVLNRFVENPKIVREFSEENGPYVLEVVADIESDSSVITIQYEYIRKGKFPDNNSSTETHVEEVQYENGVPVGGKIVSVYSSESGNWQDA
jgi:hypothetical protein